MGLVGEWDGYFKAAIVPKRKGFSALWKSPFVNKVKLNDLTVANDACTGVFDRLHQDGTRETYGASR